MSPVSSLPRVPRWTARLIPFLAILLLVLGASIAQPATAQAPGEQTTIISVDPWIEAATHTLVVRVAPGVNLEGDEVTAATSARPEGTRLAETLRQAGVTGAKALLPTGGVVTTAGGAPSRLARIFRLQLNPTADVGQVKQTLAANPALERVEYDYIARGVLVPNDPEYPDQWAAPRIGLPAAWDVSTGSGDVVIALVDSGLDVSHADLAGRLWVNAGEIPGNGIDDDANGYIDDVNGWNFVSDNNNLVDSYGHGTQVAGVMAAVGNNGRGIAGVCWQCKIMVVTAMQNGGAANYSDIAAAVAYASSNGADVINLSLGGYADSSMLADAVVEASVTAVLVGGAGNDDSSSPFYPAAYPEVVGVTATDDSDAKAIFSNYGSWVDVVAPGDTIRTTALGGGYGTDSGTSLATAFASGVAGLIASKHPDWSPDLVAWQLLNTSASIDGQNAAYVGQLGHGRIAANQALTVNPQPAGEVASFAVDGQTGAQPAPGATFALVVDVRNLWLPGRSLNGVLSTTSPRATITSANGTFGDIDTGHIGSNVTTPFQVQLAANTPYAAEIPFRLSLTGASGYALNLDFTVRVRSAVETLNNINYTANTTWTSDKTYVLIGSVIVGEGATLTIQPGTQIKVAADKFIRVDGTLIAKGTADQPIIFAANDPATPWTGIRFSDSAISTTVTADGAYISGSVIQFVHISLAAVAVDLGTRELLIADSTFEIVHPSNSPGAPTHVGITSPGIDTWQVASRIERNQFSGNGRGTGIFMQWSSPQIRQNTFTNLDGGLDIYGSGSSIVEANRFNNVGNAISVRIYGSPSESIGCGNQVVRGNTIVGGGSGITVQGHPIIEGNLLDRNGGTGLTVQNYCTAVGVITSTARIRNNTISNAGVLGVMVGGEGALAQDPGDLTAIDFSQNNIFGSGEFDLYMAGASAGRTLDARGNFWNVPSGEVAERIRDCTFDLNGCGGPSSTIGKVLFDPPLTSPVQDAPAFVTSIKMTPDPVGLQQGVLTVDFSAPMMTAVLPTMAFHDARRGTTQQMSNIGTPQGAMATDVLGRVWFGSGEGTGDGVGARVFDGRGWITHTVANSGIASNRVSHIFAASNGDVWIAADYFQPPSLRTGLSRLRGTTWVTYTVDGSIVAGGEDQAGAIWFGTSGNGVFRYDGTTWQQFTIEDGLADNFVVAIARDGQGYMWFHTTQGLSVFDGVNWTTRNPTNGLPISQVYPFFADSQGRVWVVQETSSTHLAMFDGSLWHYFGPAETDDLVNYYVMVILESPDGAIWVQMPYDIIATYKDGIWSRPTSVPHASVEGLLFDHRGNLWFRKDGIAVLWFGLDYASTDGQWLSPTRFQAIYDFTPLVPQGTYSLTITGAIGTDGLPAASTTTVFDVAYGGGVSSVPPLPPQVTLASDGSLTTLALSWPSQSGVEGYRYAIGTVVGGRDVLGWTYSTANSVTRSGLKLVSGKTYYVTVQAQGTNGLWSTNTTSASFVAGQINTDNTGLFLPSLGR